MGHSKNRGRRRLTLPLPLRAKMIGLATPESSDSRPVASVKVRSAGRGAFRWGPDSTPLS